MTIASEITRINGNIAAAYTAAGNKGATLPATQNSANLATCIGTISGGGGGYSELPNYQVTSGVAQKRTLSLTGNEFAGITSVDTFGLYYAFFNCTGLTGAVVFPSLTTISGINGMAFTFRGCTGLTSVDLSSLTTISGANGLVDVFYDCSGITSVNLSALTSLSGNSCMQSAFNGCKALTDVYFNSLTTTSFGSYVNQFSSMMTSTGSKVTHKLHFPSNLESTISGLSGYPLFGGTSGYVVLAFDLPATS